MQTQAPVQALSAQSTAWSQSLSRPSLQISAGALAPGAVGVRAVLLAVAVVVRAVAAGDFASSSAGGAGAAEAAGLGRRSRDVGAVDQAVAVVVLGVAAAGLVLGARAADAAGAAGGAGAVACPRSPWYRRASLSSVVGAQAGFAGRAGRARVPAQSVSAQSFGPSPSLSRSSCAQAGFRGGAAVGAPARSPCPAQSALASPSLSRPSVAETARSSARRCTCSRCRRWRRCNRSPRSRSCCRCRCRGRRAQQPDFDRARCSAGSVATVSSRRSPSEPSPSSSMPLLQISIFDGLAGGVADAIGVLAVAFAVAVVVPPIVAGGFLAAGLGEQTGGVQAVDEEVAVVVHAVGAVRRRCSPCGAIRRSSGSPRPGSPRRRRRRCPGHRCRRRSSGLGQKGLPSQVGSWQSTSASPVSSTLLLQISLGRHATALRAVGVVAVLLFRR